MFEGYTSLTNPQKREFAEISNRLLTNSFLARDKKDNKDSFYFVTAFKDLFVEFFNVLDYELILDRELGIIQLISKLPSTMIKLKKDESIVLLILRLIYHEKLRQTTLNTNVVLQISEIHSKYDTLEIRRKLTKTDLIAMLRLFRRYNIIETLGDIQQSTTQLIIFPTILYALKTEDITEVYNTIIKIKSEGDAKNEEAN